MLSFAAYWAYTCWEVRHISTLTRIYHFSITISKSQGFLEVLKAKGEECGMRRHFETLQEKQFAWM